MNQNKSNNDVEFSIVDGGPLDRGLNRTGLNKPGAKFLGLRLGRTGGDLLAAVADFVG